MADQTKNTLIGIFVLAALGIIIYILLFLHPTIGDEGQVIRARFTDIDKVSVGTRVLFAGLPVGEVAKIEEVYDARNPENIRDGKVYIYELTLEVDSGIILYTTDEIASTTSGLLGEKSISIMPLPPKEGKALVRLTDHVMYATPPASVEDALKNFSQFSEFASVAMEKVNNQLDTIEDSRMWENLADTALNINEITTSMNRPGDWENIVQNFSTFSDDISKGDGTVGRLIHNDDLYLQLVSILSKGETIMDDINHYGLLFQNNKSWQRLRARRMDLLAQLECPLEFQNFFNDEINQISTSLSRVSMVLGECQDCYAYWADICSPEFAEVFAELLRRVDSLNDNLKMVDQQVVEKREKCCR